MRDFTCGGPGLDAFPDVGNGDVPCCEGSAIYGPSRCTCWRPIYDVKQGPIRRHSGPLAKRDSLCGDCAYRPDSPEKRGDPRAAGNPEDLDSLAAGNTPFFCHQGVRRVIAYRHPSGAEITTWEGDYAPPLPEGVPVRADGTPALICAGWVARRKALTARPRISRELPPPAQEQP